VTAAYQPRRSAIGTAAVGVATLAGWQALVTASGVPPVVLPSPGLVAATAVAMLPTLAGDAAVTAATALLGLAAGAAVGLAAAAAAVESRTAEAAVYPALVALRVAPLVALAPLLFVWFGDGVPARAALVATMTAFPVAAGSLDGLRSVPDRYLDLARSVDAPAHTVFLRVRLPAAAPSVLAGVKVAAAVAVVGAVVAEFLALDAGLGYRVLHASRRMRTPRAFAALAALAAVGGALYLAVALAERRF
jgi:ABC-type nitrate/sulfonate/bicarbonate transport system permease component